MLIGSRVSISIGVVAVLISNCRNLFVHRRVFWRKSDALIMACHIIWSIPTLLLVIAITLALGKGLAGFVAVGLTMWVEVARVVRGQVIVLRKCNMLPPPEL
jgi:peptide/nickel transport system permease protein